MCFNSRTREGCDLTDPSLSPAEKVSIHAPGRGATDLNMELLKDYLVSIHAPGRGATCSD